MKKTIMKDFRILGMLLMAGSALMACSSDDNMVEQSAQADAPKVYTVTVEGARKGGDPASTRGTLAEADKGTTVSTAWATTDKVYVKVNGTLAGGTLSPTTAGANANLSGQLSGVTFTQDNAVDLYTYDDDGITFSSYDNQAGTLQNIGEKYDFCHIQGQVSSVDTKGNITINLSNGGTFTNDYAIVKFTLVDKADTSKRLKPSKLTVTFGESGSFDVTPTDATWTANGDDVLYVAVPNYDGAVTLTATVGTDTYTCTAASQTFTAGNFYRITAQMAKPAEGHALSDSSVGEIVGSDGKAYAVADKDNLPEGVTAVAMVAYKKDADVLAIQLNSNPETENWENAKKYAEGLTPVHNCTWRLPSKDDWQNMFVGCAVSGDATKPDSDNMDPIEGFKAKIAATGTAWPSNHYWSSTQSDSNAWYVDVNLSGSNAIAGFYKDNTSHKHCVLGCLALNQ